ncbi:MAG: GntR family transcriptional regulator, transcriptional repressor for pyruvate dehydrogenase complex [Tepidanaerobacteraceae bacterium]|nr:GntR family transcriptional regulator, transcriptional repressor for pyruvate dehydrogenase complex [Tepidanaerobacteraceae bacterium]
MVKRKNLSNEVAAQIKKMIQNKKFLPGSKLPNETELSEMMNVSRTTIREAIKLLASNNIVEIIRGKGTFVSEMPGLIKDPLGVGFMEDKNLLFSLFETRILIEPKVASIAAKRATPEDIKKIKEHVDEMREVINGKQSHKEKDIEFHTQIARAMKNPIIERIVPIIIESITKGYYETINVPGSAQKAVLSHEKIYEAIKNHDAAAAEREMKFHLEEALKDIGWSQDEMTV